MRQLSDFVGTRWAYSDSTYGHSKSESTDSRAANKRENEGIHEHQCDQNSQTPCKDRKIFYLGLDCIVCNVFELIFES